MNETKFKDTEVGKIPEDWELKPLWEIGTFSKGGGISREESHTGDLPAVRYGELYINQHDYIRTFHSHISRELANHARLLKKGDILFTSSGETKEDIGKSVAYCDDYEVYAGGDLIILSPEDGYYPMFMGYVTNAEYVRKQKALKGQGDAVVHITAKSIGELKIAFPKFEEQRRIAKALSDIDSLIMQLDKLIEKKRAIKQGAMQQLLTGKVRLKGFTKSNDYKVTDIGVTPNDWEVKSINDVAANYIGLTYHPVNVRDYGTLVLRSSNIRDSKIVFDDNVFVEMDIPERAIAHFGDILICVRNGSSALIGKSALITSNAEGKAFGAFMTVLRTNVMDTSYLFYVWNSKKTQDQIHENFGATINQITSKDFSRILIAVPSLTEQRAISSVLSSMDNEISVLESKRDKYTAIKQGMMQQLLTGKIRLLGTIAKPNNISANVHFRRSVLAAEIADRLCEEPTFGHVKMEKMLFLSERMCRIDIGSHYHRDAAGPYDNRALHSIDSQLKKQKWFEVKHTDKGNRYVPMQNRGKHSIYFTRYYADVLPMFEKIISTFRSWNTERCEIVATLYSAWEDMLHSNKPFTDADIVNEVLNNWHESKKRISQERWFNALQWMHDNGFTPENTKP